MLAWTITNRFFLSPLQASLTTIVAHHFTIPTYIMKLWTQYLIVTRSSTLQIMISSSPRPQLDYAIFWVIISSHGSPKTNVQLHTPPLSAYLGKTYLIFWWNFFVKSVLKYIYILKKMRKSNKKRFCKVVHKNLKIEFISSSQTDIKSNYKAFAEFDSNLCSLNLVWWFLMFQFFGVITLGHLPYKGISSCTLKMYKYNANTPMVLTMIYSCFLCLSMVCNMM